MRTVLLPVRNIVSDMHTSSEYCQCVRASHAAAAAAANLLTLHTPRTLRIITPPAYPPVQGGLLCLAAIAVGLGAQNEEFLGEIVPPVLESFVDQDARVRYYGLESLYNIAKVSRGAFNRFFAETFDSLFRLCADSERDVQVRPSYPAPVSRRKEAGSLL